VTTEELEHPAAHITARTATPHLKRQNGAPDAPLPAPSPQQPRAGDRHARRARFANTAHIRSWHTLPSPASPPLLRNRPGPHNQPRRAPAPRD